MTTHLLVLQGPNLNRLGKRAPHLYGAKTLEQVSTEIELAATSASMTVEQFQSNHEGFLIDWLQERQDSADAVIVNPAGLTHSAAALRDALQDTGLPVAVVHITQIHARPELTSRPYRHTDIYSDVATCYLAGLGWRGYLHAVDALSRLVGEREDIKADRV